MAPGTTCPQTCFSQSGPLSLKGPKGCISTVVQMGAVPKICLSVLASVAAPPPRQPPSWVPGRAWSCLEGPKSAQQTSSQMSSPSRGFAWAELGSPQGSTQGHRLSRRPKASHWEAEACGWAVSSAQSGKCPAEVPSRGVGQAPGTLLSKGGPL